MWLNGALVPRSQALVSIDDFGFLYGAACFETMPAFGGVVFRLTQHLARLAGGLAALGVPVPADLQTAVALTLEANALDDARVRLTVSAGPGAGRPDLTSAQGPTVVVVAEPLPPDPAPAKLAVVSQRIDGGRPLAAAKTANYLASIVALNEARAAGADEALLLGPRGDVVEAATANVFAIAAGVLLTPPLSAGPLPGVTRRAVLECAHVLGLPAGERRLTTQVLATADELFLTSSVAGIRPVSAVLGRWARDAVPGPHTYALREAYRELVRRECRQDRR